MPKRRTSNELHNKMIYFRATESEAAALKKVAQVRDQTITSLIWEAIYAFLKWK